MITILVCVERLGTTTGSSTVLVVDKRGADISFQLGPLPFLVPQLPHVVLWLMLMAASQRSTSISSIDI